MRGSYIPILVVVGISAVATAGPRSGGGSGGNQGGRLSQVSAGIAGATSAGRGSGGSHSSQARSWATPCPSEGYRRRVYDGLCVRRCPDGQLYRVADGTCLHRTVALVMTPGAMIEAEGQTTPARPQGPAHVSAYLGAQKVFESDGAIALELAVADRWLRLGGTLTRFYERQQSGETLTLTMPSLALGVRIDDSASTRVYIEAGVVGAMTRND